MRVTIRAVGDVRGTVLRALCLALLATLVLAPSGLSASPCAKTMLADWRDDGRIDRLYPLRCYQEAIDAIPADIVQYGNADEVIARALQSALREQGITRPGTPVTPRLPNEDPPTLPPTPPVNTSATTALPLPLIVLGGMALALLATGGLGWIARRRRES